MAQVYKIEKNIPRNKNPNQSRATWNYPLATMKKGDSFLTEELFDNASRTKVGVRCKRLLEYLIENAATVAEKESLIGRAYTAGRDPERKLPNGKIDPNSGKYVRVWRTK